MARNRVDDYYDYIDAKRQNDSVYKSINKEFCVFISHKHDDSEKARNIANYIMKNADIDVYLDQKDNGLQRAVRNNDNEAIVKYIERGIHECTHILCLISEKTNESWWVPYEVGYAKNAKKEIVSLKLKNVKDIPSFLKIETVLNGTKSLNEYLEKIKNPYYSLLSYSQQNHPLDNYLNWEV